MFKATPRNIYGGAQDKSKKKVYPVAKKAVQHAPLIFLNTPFGSLKRQHVTGGELLELYGENALDTNSNFTTHVNVFAKTLLSYGGGTVVVNRVVPKVDFGKATERDPNRAGMTVYLFKSSEKTGKPYLRGEDNKVLRTVTGEPKYDESASDITYVETGLITKKNNDVDSVVAFDVEVNGEVIGHAVPLFTVEAEAPGEPYNEYGLGIECKIGESLDQGLAAEKAFGYKLRVYKGDSIFKTVDSEKEVEFAFKPYTKDIRDVFPAKYGNLVDPRRPLQTYTFEETRVHEDGSLVCKDLVGVELAGFGGTMPVWEDFQKIGDMTDEDVKEAYKYFVNFISCKTSDEVEYEYIRPMTFDFATASALKAQGIYPMSTKASIPTRLTGGENGDIDNLEAFEAAVIKEMEKYMDRSSDVHDLAVNPATSLYDSGFKWETKLALAKFIGLRKDTNVYLAVAEFDKDNKRIPISDYLAKGAELQAHLRLYVESAIYNTPTSRGMVFMQTGKLKDGSFRYRVPMTFDYAVKMQRYAGALDGNFNSDNEFSRDPGNIVDVLIDIDPARIPDTVKDALWDSGLVWVQNKNDLEYIYPQQQTVNPDDNSVLNNAITALALGTTARVHYNTWLKFTGARDLSNSEFIIQTQKYMQELLDNRFGDIKATAKTIITGFDEANGFSWTTEIDLYAPMMKTVEESRTVVYRIEDYKG